MIYVIGTRTHDLTKQIPGDVGIRAVSAGRHVVKHTCDEELRGTYSPHRRIHQLTDSVPTYTLATVTSTCAMTILTTPTTCAIYTVAPAAVVHLSVRCCLLVLVGPRGGARFS